VARLCEEQVLHIVGLVDPYHMGMDAPALIGVSLRAEDLQAAVETISGFEEVSYLVMVSGEFDLIVEALCRDRDHLATFLNEKLRRTPGVVATRTFTILRTYKMAYGARPVLGTPVHVEQPRP